MNHKMISSLYYSANLKLNTLAQLWIDRNMLDLITSSNSKVITLLGKVLDERITSECFCNALDNLELDDPSLAENKRFATAIEQWRVAKEDLLNRWALENRPKLKDFSEMVDLKEDFETYFDQLSLFDPTAGESIYSELQNHHFELCAA